MFFLKQRTYATSRFAIGGIIRLTVYIRVLRVYTSSRNFDYAILYALTDWEYAELYVLQCCYYTMSTIQVFLAP